MTTPPTPGEEPDRPEGQRPSGDQPNPRQPDQDPYWSQPTPPPGEYPPPGYGSQRQQPGQGDQPQYPQHPGHGGQPPQTPPPGYQQGGGYQAPGYPQQGGYGYPSQGASDPRDPVYSSDFGNWWQNTMDVFGRSWQIIGGLMLIGVFIPSWVVSTTSTLSGRSQSSGSWRSGFSWDMIGGSVAPFLLSLVLGYLTAVAWSGSLRAATIEAAGGRTSFAESLSYGFRRGLRLWGWGLLAYLTVTIGLILCVIPGLWALFALSLIAPVTVFERVNSYGRSIKLTHSRFGPTLGRLAITFLLIAAYGCVVNLISGIVLAAFGVGTGGLTGVGAFIVALVIQAIVSLLFLIPGIWLVGAILCTYAGIRGRTEPISAASLAAEADR